MYTKKNIIQTLAVFFVLVIIFFIFQSTTKPWEAGGRLLLTVQATPQGISETTLGFGIDDVEIYKADGSKEKVPVRTRRVTLDPKNIHTEIVVDETVPVGAYTGFGFSIHSPEIRNNWEEESAPGHVSLAGEFITITSPFHVEENVTSALLLAFETLQAIHEDDGAKVYLPVIQVETRFNTEHIVTENQNVLMQGGSIESNATYGMDWDGTMRFNFRAKSREVVVEETIPQELPSTLQVEDASSTPLTTASTSEEVRTEEVSSTSPTNLEESEDS